MTAIAPEPRAPGRVDRLTARPGRRARIKTGLIPLPFPRLVPAGQASQSLTVT